MYLITCIKIRQSTIPPTVVNSTINHGNGKGASSIVSGCTHTMPEEKKERAVEPGHWKVASNRRQYMERLGLQLGYEGWPDWYQIDTKAFKCHHGTGLLHHIFHNSPSAAVVDTFPEHKWERFKFKVVPHGYWDVASNRREYMGWLAQQLGLRTLEDWYKIDNVSLLDHYGGGLLKKYGNSPRSMVAAVWPDHHWIQSKFVGKIDLVYRHGKKVKLS